LTLRLMKDDEFEGDAKRGAGGAFTDNP
jgi:hypothetical protein